MGWVLVLSALAGRAVAGDSPAAAGAPAAGAPAHAAEADPAAPHGAEPAAVSHAAASHGAGQGGAAKHGAGGHHDESDLTTANAGPKLEDPSEWRYDLALCTLAVFLCSLGLLTKFAWKPIMTGLDQRERSILQRIEDANRDAEQAAELVRQREAQLAAVAGEAQQMFAQAMRQAEAQANQVRAEAQADAARERERMVADIRLAKNAAIREVARQSADMAVALAGRIVHRELQPGGPCGLDQPGDGTVPQQQLRLPSRRTAGVSPPVEAGTVPQ